MKREQDRFANPVGQTITRALGPILDLLIDDPDATKLAPLVDDILRIRAVQSLKPSDSLAFLFHLKQVVREQLRAEKLESPLVVQLMLFESRIDELTLQAFDTYLGFREKIYEIRATELRKRSQRVLEKMNRRFDERAAPAPSTDPARVEASKSASDDESESADTGDKRGGTT